MDSSALKDIVRMSPLFLLSPAPSQRQPCCQFPLCLSEIFLYASTVCGMQPLLLKQMRKDPKHYFAPCFLHLVKLGDHNISVQIVLHSSEQPHSNPLSPCLPPPPSLITTLLWAPLCGPAPHLQTLSSNSSLHILRLLSACCPKLLA